MANALFARRAGRHGLSFSAGTDPKVGLDGPVLDAMSQIGISLAGTFPKPYTAEILTAADVIVTFDGAPQVQVPAGTRHVVWDVPDPRGRALADDLGVPAAA